MKNYKGNMLLIELIIVILFFSLSQLVVVRLFAAANEKALGSAKLSSALCYVEDIAERLSQESNPDAALLRLGFVGGDGRYVISSQQGYDVQAVIQQTSQPAGDMLQTTLTAQAEGQTLLSLPVACYLPKEAQP